MGDPWTSTVNPSESHGRAMGNARISFTSVSTSCMIHSNGRRATVARLKKGGQKAETEKVPVVVRVRRLSINDRFGDPVLTNRG